jgi:UrcA family protein
MTFSIVHTRSLLLATAAAMTFMTAQAADEKDKMAGRVTVEAERPTTQVVGRSTTGAPLVEVQLRHVVSYADLELSIPSNAKVLRQRVETAAREVCTDLDRLYPNPVGADSCARKAADNAKPQVEAAIADAQARKNSEAAQKQASDR